MTKNDNRADLPPGYQKTTKNQKYEYFIIPCANSPPKKEKMDPSGPPPGSSPELPGPLLSGQDVLGPLPGPKGAQQIGGFRKPFKTNEKHQKS